MIALGSWYSQSCEYQSKFICAGPLEKNGNHTLVLGSESLTDHTLKFWWNPVIDGNGTPQFRLNWQIKNGSLPDIMELVSKDLPGSVSTPGLGSLSPPNYYKERHEYTSVIELPHNITDVIGDGALVIDVEIFADNQCDNRVELLTEETKLQYNNVKMSWSTAEEFCVSKRGHLASVASRLHWYKLQSFISGNNIVIK